MNKIVKYNSFDEDIIAGDIIVFSDGTTKVLRKIDDGHKAVFADGSKCDLFVVEVEGIIKEGDRNPKQPFSESSLSSFTNSLSLFEPVNKEPEKKKSFFKDSYDYEEEFTYSELFSMMEKADHSGLYFSKYFWHYTTVSNLCAIVRDGKFKSRYDVEGYIPHDNKILNSTSKEVMSNNASRKTQTHVRFYLRPLNKPYFSFYKNLSEEDKKLCCYVCIKKEALYASFKSTFLYYENAVTATDDVFDKRNELNQHQWMRFRVNNLKRFNFAETYSIYDPSQDAKRSLYQEAEFLVWKELSFNFVGKIYFRTQQGLDIFLKKIRDNKEYNSIKEKCSVNRTYFGY